MSAFPDYGRYDGLGLAELVRKGEVQPIELVEEAIARIEAVNPQINAVIYKAWDQARAAARSLPNGPFRGVPFLVKDIASDWAGVPSTQCSKFTCHWRPDHDSEIVCRYKTAGLVLMGKTNAPELGLLPTTEPRQFGPTLNPWDITRTPGGSAGGSAAAVAARVLPMAHGNDGGGSIRIPASCCGLFGLKPTRGRTPIGPDTAEEWQGLSINHGLTISVRDSAALLDATSGPEAGDPYVAPPTSRPFLAEVGADPGRLRIAFTAVPPLPATVHPDCVAGVRETAKLCASLGHELVEAAPKVDGKAFAWAFLVMVCAETRANISRSQALTGRKAKAADFEPQTWAMALMGGQFTAGQLAEALEIIKRTGRQMAAFFRQYDLLLTPTLAMPPVKTGALQPKGKDLLGMKLLGPLNAGKLLMAMADIDALAAATFAFMPFTPLFNASGEPAMSVPLVWNEQGLPIGMHFVGRFGDEATLFRLAAQLEQARPWKDRIPSVHA